MNLQTQLELNSLQERSAELKADLPKVRSRYSRQAIRNAIGSLQSRIDRLNNAEISDGGDAA